MKAESKWRGGCDSYGVSEDGTGRKRGRKLLNHEEEEDPHPSPQDYAPSLP